MAGLTPMGPLTVTPPPVAPLPVGPLPVAPLLRPAAAGPALTMSAVAPATHHGGFHDLLSELNPLQYIPVIGTLYRAVTGDTIPETARQFGSFAVSGLIGGPVGMATNLALLAIEKVTGIDPEQIGQTFLNRLGIGHAAVAADADAVASPTAAAAPAASAIAVQPGAQPGAQPVNAVAPTSHPVAWSASQLTAYGVTRTADGSLRRGNVTGADVLNDLELARHQPPAAADTPAPRPVSSSATGGAAPDGPG